MIKCQRTGSPPRMRGKVQYIRFNGASVGITPAYAGKSVRLVEIFLRHGDHPRVCGEKNCVESCTAGQAGSPPRMRGKVFWHNIYRTHAGITPAYAGKREGNSGRSSRNWDHPRVCGEKDIALLCRERIIGSPPRMRGKVLSRTPQTLQLRITPAYAGKRRFMLQGCYIIWDHPRVCGEKQKKAMEQEQRNRITPAYAGKSQICIFARKRSQDHPRVCGEKFIDLSHGYNI